MTMREHEIRCGTLPARAGAATREVATTDVTPPATREPPTYLHGGVAQRPADEQVTRGGARPLPTPNTARASLTRKAGERTVDGQPVPVLRFQSPDSIRREFARKQMLAHDRAVRLRLRPTEPGLYPLGHEGVERAAMHGHEPMDVVAYRVQMTIARNREARRQ